MKRFPGMFLENLANRISSGLNTTPAGLANKISMIGIILSISGLFTYFSFLIKDFGQEIFFIRSSFTIIFGFFYIYSCKRISHMRNYNFTVCILMLACLIATDIIFFRTNDMMIRYTVIPTISVFLIGKGIVLYNGSKKIHKDDLQTIEKGNLPQIRLEDLHFNFWFLIFTNLVFLTFIACCLANNLEYVIAAIPLIMCCFSFCIVFFLLAVIPRPPTKGKTKIVRSLKGMATNG